jgi:hypothetical protein
MSKQVEGVFTLERIQEVKTLLKEGKYVTMDSITALEAIKTILTIGQLKEFITNALQALENITFSLLNFDQTREYIEHEFQMPRQPNGQNFGINEMRLLFDHCEIYAQRYDIPISNPKSNIFIQRTRTQKDFDIAKGKIVELLKSFQKGENVQNIKDITVMIRGNDKFMDIEIENINDRAWVGFDFR